MKRVAVREKEATSKRGRITEGAKQSQRRLESGYNARESCYLECGLDLQKVPVAHYHHNDCSDEPVLWAPYQNGGGRAGNHDHDEMPEVSGWERDEVVALTETIGDDTRLNKDVFGPSTERYSPSGLVDWQQYESK